jgi:opacity protein-like surface antigen
VSRVQLKISIAICIINTEYKSIGIEPDKESFMRQKKLLIVTTAALVAASFPLYVAAQAGLSSAASAVKATSQIGQASSQASSQEETARVTQPHTAAPMQDRSILTKPSFYAGLGIAMLNNRGFTGLMPKIMLGYGMFFGHDKNFYSALEIGGGAGTILLSTNNQRYRVSNFVNASFIPGYKVYDDVMLYARLGAQATRYSKLNSTEKGAVYGLGIELTNTEHWDTRLEYNYAIHKNLNQYIVDLIYKFR